MLVSSRTKRTRLLVATVLLFWLVLALGASLSGVFAQVRRSQLPLLPFAVAAPIIIFFLWRASSAGFRLFLLSIDLRRLVAVQLSRVIGGVLLVFYARGALPGSFALPAGLGDILVGVTAPFVARATSSQTPLNRRLIVLWCVLGIGDLVVALTLGTLNSATSVGVLATEVTTAPMAFFPLSLFPTYLVPLSIVLHLITLQRVIWNNRT